MSTISKKDMSQIRSLLNKWSRKYKVTFTFISHKCQKWQHFYAIKHGKKSTVGNSQLHSLMLMHVLNNIFLRFIHNIYKIVLTLRYFSYIYVSYQMYKTWSCWTFYHALNRFPQGNDNHVSTSRKWFNIEVYTRSTCFHFELDHS